MAPITLELPSGSFADVLCGKWSMTAGATLIAGSTALMFVADSLWLLLSALCLVAGWQRGRVAGRPSSPRPRHPATLVAFLFDSLGDEPTGTRFTNLLVFG